MKALALVLAVVLVFSGCMLASKKSQEAAQVKYYVTTTFTSTSSAIVATTSNMPTTTTTIGNVTPANLTRVVNTPLNISCPTCPKGLDLKTSKWLLNLRTSGQVPSYQAGYFDCKDEVLEGLEIMNRSRFREAPKFSNSYTKPVEVDNVACYLVNKTGWIVLNRTQADFKVIDNKLLLRPLKVQVLGQ